MSKEPIQQTPRFDWRKYLAVHPAAELFPLMSEAELKELAVDIEKDGLRIPTVMWPNSDRKLLLIDGRNRLDALALLGRLGVDESECLILKDPRPNDRFQFECAHDVSDPYALAVSLNVHRRHLTAEQKRNLIANLLKVTPEKSNRQIADQVKVSHPTVAKVREQLEEKGDVEKVTTSIDSKGRRQPAKKRKAAETTAAKPERKAVSALDSALVEFDAHVLRLLKMTRLRNPGRFAKSAVDAPSLMQLGCFLNDLADAMRNDVATSAEAMKAKHATLDIEAAP